MAAFSDYVENKVTDLLLRGQAFTAPVTVYVGLMTTASGDANASGVEVTGGAYARVAITTSLLNWSGTQGAASTGASSGAGGLSSNNAIISFATPSAGWGLVTHFVIYDALTVGNLLIRGALGTQKNINSGDSVSFAVNTLTLTID